jgi:hypothetical protein
LIKKIVLKKYDLQKPPYDFIWDLNSRLWKWKCPMHASLADSDYLENQVISYHSIKASSI